MLVNYKNVLFFMGYYKVSNKVEFMRGKCICVVKKRCTNSNIEDIWESVIIMCGLFKNTAIFVGKELGYEYNSLEGRKAMEFLKHVRQLSKDASEIY